jgi:hypothetical protein
MLTRYKPSGKTSARILPTALVGAALGVGLAWPYQAVIKWVPLIYINLVVWLVFAALVGGIVAFACSIGHNRNRFIGVLAGASIAVAAVGASHYWGYRSARSEIVDELTKSDVTHAEAEALVASEVTFGRYIEARVDTGWSLGSGSSDGKGDLVGPLVWIIWGIEALGVLGAAVYFGGKGNPFCEKCNKSLDEHTLFTRTDLDLNDLTGISEAHQPETLVEVPPRGQTSAVGLRVKYSAHVCPTCEGDAYLTVKSIMPSMKEGESDEETTIHEEVVLQRSHYNRLLALGDELGQSGSVSI